MPSIMEWDETLEVHVGKIDEQHKKFINIIKSLHHAIDSDKTKNEEKEVLVELIKYTDYHFSTENDLMIKYDYPQRENHLSLHTEFTEKLKKFCVKHKEGDSTVSRDMINFLIRWIIHHIMNVDQKLGVFLNKRGVN